MIRSIEKFSDLIRNKTRDLPACSIVPQQTTLPRVPHILSNLVIYTMWYTQKMVWRKNRLFSESHKQRQAQRRSWTECTSQSEWRKLSLERHGWFLSRWRAILISFLNLLWRILSSLPSTLRYCKLNCLDQKLMPDHTKGIDMILGTLYMSTFVSLSNEYLYSYAVYACTKVWQQKQGQVISFIPTWLASGIEVSFF
jgi:hypothetical protein